MKKKLLSLVLAGAMVASTSVSAFAEQISSEKFTDTVSSEKYEATGGDVYSFTDEKDANISIEGKIANSDDKVTPSTISVTVPTAAKFTVDSKGNLIGSNINITSQGDTEVQVIAYKFADPTGTSGINAVSLSDLNAENQKSSAEASTVDRSKVYLKLVGDQGSVSLQTRNGVCGLEDSDNVSNTVLGKVGKGKSLKLNLDGKAVTTGNALSTPVSDDFTLTLKLKKVTS